MCTPGTVTRIFIDGRTLHIKRFVGKFKQRTVPVPLQKKRTVAKPEMETGRVEILRPVGQAG